MKKIICLFILIYSASSLSAQWTSQNPPLPNVWLNAVAFINTSTGFAIGNDVNGGVSLKTTDAGITWNNNATVQPYDLMDACFTSSSTGYICGANSSNSHATVLKTTDGGSTWSATQLASSYALFNIHFYDDQHGFTSDIHGTFFRTNDGGNTWTIVNGGWGPVSVQGIHCLNASLVFIVGDEAYGGIRKSTDGGVNWTTLSHPTTTQLNDLFFIDVNTGWCVGVNGTILKTIDGGNTWIQQISGTTNTFLSVHFLNALVGYIVGNNGTILKTSNGGTTWSIEISNTTKSLQSVYCVSAQQAYAVGASSTIQTTFAGNFPSGLANEAPSKLDVSVSTSGCVIQLSTTLNHILSVIVTDIHGRCIFKITDNIQKINTKLSGISSLSSGMYLVQINDLITHQSKCEKLMIK